jgi:hypothetical protein
MTTKSKIRLSTAVALILGLAAAIVAAHPCTGPRPPEPPTAVSP